MQKLTDAELRQRKMTFKMLARSSKTLDDILLKHLQLLEKLQGRVLGMRHFGMSVNRW